jgi:hypothetical protein
MFEARPDSAKAADMAVSVAEAGERLAFPRAAVLIVAMSLAAWCAIAAGWRLLV